MLILKKKSLTIATIILSLMLILTYNVSALKIIFTQNQTWGDTLYVGGSGPGNYTYIQDAIDNASDGDTIYVYPKTYLEHITIDQKNNLTLKGANTYSTIIQGEVYLNQCTKTTITTFTITNSITAIHLDNGGNNIITRNYITNHTQHGIWLNPSNYNTIENNKIKNCTIGIYLDIHLYKSCRHNSIINNHLENNSQAIYLRLGIKNQIIQNNFNSNIQDAYHDFCKQTIWKNNYWNAPRLLPKIIFGTTIFNLPWVNIDWHPASEPFIIFNSEET